MLEMVRVTFLASSVLNRLTTAFLIKSGTSLIPGICSNFSKPSMRALTRSSFRASRSLASKPLARVSSVSSPRNTQLMRMELKKLRVVSVP